MRETVKNIGQNSWYLNQDSNQAPPKHKSETLPLEYSVPVLLCGVIVVYQDMSF